MTNVPSEVPAGWYDDGSGRTRWFDGEQWGAYRDAEAAIPAPTEEPVLIRRNQRGRFLPPAETAGEQSGVTVSRSWALGLRAANAKTASGLTRNRKIAGDLPAWAPLPPGELGVVRDRGKRS